ncbi:MAG: hypothetical protein ACXWDL_13140, partial [Nocardioides sp.]
MGLPIWFSVEHGQSCLAIVVDDLSAWMPIPGAVGRVAGSRPECLCQPWRMEVFETRLPGIGIRYEFTSSANDRLGVVVRRDGRRELVLYDEEDPDA